MQAIFDHRMILQTIACTEVYVVLIRYEIVARRIDGVGHHIAIPPGKRAFARFYP